MALDDSFIEVDCNLTLIFLSLKNLTEFFLLDIYRPQRSCGQGNIFAPVCHSVHGGGLPQCMLGCHPPGSRDATPGSRHPHPPRSRHPPEQTPPAADTPPEADSGIRSMSGRYVSYWNAFLSCLFLLTSWTVVCLTQRYVEGLTATSVAATRSTCRRTTRTAASRASAPA